MKTILWNSTEAEVVTGGESSGAWAASGVSLNINDIHDGDLFLASPDDDIDLAYRRGAAVVAVPRGVNVSGDRPVLKVGSAFTALQGLSAAARFRTHACVISVQGRDARDQMNELLSVSYDVHEGGKHVSLGLANLPEDADFGVFGVSPAVKPDIAVITNPATAYRDTLFEHMGPESSVIIYADADGFLDVVARARAAGIQNILTYGRHECADIAIDHCLVADNGIRIRGHIMGEPYALVVPNGFKDNGMILAAFLVMRLSGLPMQSVLPQSEDSEIFGKDGVSLFENAREKAGAQAVFRIRNMIDLGRGRQTAVLDNLRGKTSASVHNSDARGLQIPRQFAGFDFVHTGKAVRTVHDPYRAIRARYKRGEIEKVAPDVLAPGDFLVFREIWDSSKTIFSEALRLVPPQKQRKVHAL